MAESAWWMPIHRFASTAAPGYSVRTTDRFLEFLFPEPGKSALENDPHEAAVNSSMGQTGGHLRIGDGEAIARQSVG